MAVLGVARAAAGPSKHVITTAVEHPAVLGPCAQLEREGVAVTRLRVGSDGVVDPDDVRRALRPDTVLVSVMHANNELGTIQPVEEIARIAGRAGVPFHVDGVQALGKIPVDVEAAGHRSLQRERPQDLRSQGRGRAVRARGHQARAHRFRRPSRARPPPRHGERSRHRGVRRGGRSWPGATWRASASGSRRSATAWRTPFSSRISGVTINGSRWKRTPNTSNMCFEGIEGEALVIALDLRGFAVSTGAACSSGAVAPSHVLTAIGLPTGTRARQHAFFAWPRQHRRAGGRAGGRARGRGGAPPQNLRTCLSAPIAVAMSGGVDSSTVAALLVRQGHSRGGADHAALEPAALAGARC